MIKREPKMVTMELEEFELWKKRSTYVKQIKELIKESDNLELTMSISTWGNEFQIYTKAGKQLADDYDEARLEASLLRADLDKINNMSLWQKILNHFNIKNQ